MSRLTKLNYLKIFFLFLKYKVCLFILLSVFFFCNFSNLIAQNSNENVKLFRDKFVQIYPISNYSGVNLPRLSIKISPEFSSFCSTENRIVMECINCLNNSVINYVSFDLLYVDCNNKSWKKSISIPVNSNASISIGGKAFANNQREQIIYGLDNSNKFNTHFIYNAENAGEITNIRVTNIYEGGGQTPTSYGKMPLNIYASNIDGSTNSNNNPAEFGTKIILNWKGGELPSGGKWRLYKDKNFTKPIYEGYTDTYSFIPNEIKSSVLFTLMLVDKNGVENNSKKDINIFVAAIIQIKNEIAIKLSSKMYDEADKLCEDLKIILGDNNPEYIKLKKQIIEKKIEAINSLNNPQEKDILEIDALCKAFSLVNLTNVKLNCNFYKIELYKKLIQSYNLKSDFYKVKELIFELEKISVLLPEKQFVLLLKKENAENLLNKLFANKNFEEARNLILNEFEPIEPGIQFNKWLEKLSFPENQIVQTKLSFLFAEKYEAVTEDKITPASRFNYEKINLKDYDSSLKNDYFMLVPRSKIQNINNDYNQGTNLLQIDNENIFSCTKLFKTYNELYFRYKNNPNVTEASLSNIKPKLEYCYRKFRNTKLGGKMFPFTNQNDKSLGLFLLKI